MTYYMHSIPGRLRLKIPAIRRNPEEAKAIQALLKGLEGMESIRANTITGSLVVKYEPGRSLKERILAILKENGYFDETRAIDMDHFLIENTSKAGRALSKAFCGWAMGRALEGTSLSFLAVFI